MFNTSQKAPHMAKRGSTIHNINLTGIFMHQIITIFLKQGTQMTLSVKFLWLQTTKKQL